MLSIEQVGAKLQADMAALGQQAAVLPSDRLADDTAGSVHFGDLFAHAVKSVDAQQHHASNLMADVDSGKSDDLVGAMLASQEATLSFSMLTQVRNKVAGALDELLKLPI